MTDKEHITVAHGAIGNHPCLVVDGQSLHQALGIKSDLSGWLMRRCRDYGFEEGRDYQVTSACEIGKVAPSFEQRPAARYMLSFSMAMTLCMARLTSRSKKACHALKAAAQTQKKAGSAFTSLSPYAELRRTASAVHAHLRKAGEASRKFCYTSAELACTYNEESKTLPEYHTLLQKLDKSNELSFRALDDLAEGIVRNVEAMRVLVEDLI